MDEIRQKAVAHLKAWPGFYPTIVTGGVFDRKLATTGPGATDDAFEILANDPTKRVRIKPSIVVLGPNDVDPPSGPNGQDGGPAARNGFLRMFVYVPANAAGKATHDLIVLRMNDALDGWQAQLSTGYAMTVDAADGTELVDSDEFSDALVAQRRYAVEWLRP